MNRRDAFKVLALTSTVHCSAAESGTKQPLGLVIHSYRVRRDRPLLPEFPSVAEPLMFLDAAAKVGARGIQTTLSGLDTVAAAKLRESIEKRQMYVEGIVGLPKDKEDLARFEAEVISSKLAGATVVRSVCLSGRRYEMFASYEQFQEFADRSWRSLTLAEPVAAKHGMRLAIENHKDWRVNEMLGWLGRLSSEFVGVCLDTGNSIALLEEPHAVLEALAPWTFTTHFKDMAVAEADDGFLLSEVPLGDGLLDLPRVTAAIRQAKPGVNLNLEMISRDPLRVRCLAPTYWPTFQDVKARELAGMIAQVRRNNSPRPLPTVASLSHPQQLSIEAENITRSLKYAADNLS